MKRTLTIEISVEDDGAEENNLRIKSTLLPLPEENELSFLAGVHADIMEHLGVKDVE